MQTKNISENFELAARSLMCLELLDEDAQTTKFTFSEALLVVYLSSSLDTRSIASMLGITYNTLRKYAQHIYNKLNLHTRQEVTIKIRQILENLNLGNVLSELG